MPGVGRTHCGAEADSIAHLTDHDHIGILTHHVLESVLVGGGVESGFPLLDDALVVLEDVLDRVFHRDDVPFLIR